MQEQKELRPNRRDGFNLLTLLMAAHAATLLPWFRKGQGPEAYGVRGVAGLALLVIFASYAGGQVMWVFLGLWLAALVCRRVEAVSLRAKGWRAHSRFTGRPVVADLLKVSERAARNLEPLICVAAAIGIGIAAEEMHMPSLHPLAVYIACGLVSLGFEEVTQRMVIDRRVQAMEDAMLEQQAVMEEFQNRNRG